VRRVLGEIKTNVPDARLTTLTSVAEGDSAKVNGGIILVPDLKPLCLGITGMSDTTSATRRNQTADSVKMFVNLKIVCAPLTTKPLPHKPTRGVSSLLSRLLANG
jgi:hypothetical protein